MPVPSAQDLSVKRLKSVHKGAMEDRIIKYIKINCEDGASIETAMLPPKELAIYLQKKIG